MRIIFVLPSDCIHCLLYDSTEGPQTLSSEFWAHGSLRWSQRFRMVTPLPWRIHHIRSAIIREKGPLPWWIMQARCCLSPIASASIFKSIHCPEAASGRLVMDSIHEVGNAHCQGWAKGFWVNLRIWRSWLPSLMPMANDMIMTPITSDMIEALLHLTTICHQSRSFLDRCALDLRDHPKHAKVKVSERHRRIIFNQTLCPRMLPRCCTCRVL